MKTLDRYIAALFIKNLLLANFALTLLFVFQILLAALLDHDYPVGQILRYHALGAPAVWVQMGPPAVLIATVMTLSSLNRTNELTAAFSLGMSLSRIVSVLLAIVLVVSSLNLLLQDRLLPQLFRKRTTFYWREMKKRTDFFLDVKQNKIWYRSKNLIYNLRTFDRQTRMINGMAVYTFDNDFNLIQTVEADRALYTPNGWKLMNGTVTVFTKDDAFPLTQRFKEKELQIAETPTDFQEIEKEVDGLRLRELSSYIEKTRAAGLDTKSFEVKFHSRISLSFIPLVMCVLGVPFSTRNRREGAAAKDLGLGLGITFFYWLFYSVGLSLGTNGALPPWLAAWLPSTIFGALAATLIARRRQ